MRSQHHSSLSNLVASFYLVHELDQALSWSIVDLSYSEEQKKIREKGPS